MQKTFILLLLFLSSFMASAQGKIVVKNQVVTEDEIKKIEGELTREQLADFDIEAKRKIKELLNYLQQLSDKSISHADKLNILRLAENLFYNPRQCLIEVSSINRTTKKRYTIHDYLVNLMDSFGYEQVKITYYDSVRFNQFQRTGPGTYESVAIFYQKFEGYKNGKLVYQDKTSKKAEINLSERTDVFNEKNFTIRLGNITVEQTNQVKND